jgi:hypothetical protein
MFVQLTQLKLEKTDEQTQEPGGWDDGPDKVPLIQVNIR